MAVDGSLFFNTKVDTSGFFKGRKAISNACDGIKSAVGKLGGVIAAAFSVKAITDFSKECKELYQVQADGEIKLETIMKQRMNATDETVQSIKDYASVLQEGGVIGDEVQLAGAQQVATFLEQADSLKTLMPAMNNLLAQQNGLNASAGDAVNIGNLMGKVMQGQVGALTRVGITFSEAEEQVLKYGNETERAATLAQVITNNVGDMNAVLAQTDLGRQQQLSNTIGDIKEQFGQAVTQIEVIFLPALKNLANALSEVASFAQKTAKVLNEVFGKSSNLKVSTSGVADSSGETAENYSDMSESAEQAAEANEKSLASFDKITKLGKAETADNSNIDSDINTAGGGTIKAGIEVDTDDADSKLKAFFESIKQGFKDLIQPIKNAWNTAGTAVIMSAHTMFNSLKSTIKEVGKSFAEVWTNGTGQVTITNLLILFGDVLQIIRDISDAFRNAWQDYGTALIQSYFDRFNAILELIHTIAGSFQTMWNSGTGEQLLGDIFQIITNINDTVKNLADNFKNAWNTDGIGDKIAQAFGDLVTIISEHIKNISDNIKNWSENVDFKPLLESFEHLQEALNPIVDAVGDGLEWILNEILEPLASWTIGDLIPTFLNTLADVLDGLKSIWDKASPILKEDLWDKFLHPLAKWAGNAIIGLLKGLGTAIKTLGESITEGQVNVLVKLVETILLLKGLSAITGALQGFSKNVSTSFLGMKTSFKSAVIGLQSEATLSFGTIGAAIGAAIVGWQVGTLIYDKLCEGGWQEDFNSGMDSIVEGFKTFGENWSGFWEGIGSGFYDAKELLVSSVSDTKQQFDDFFGGIVTGAKDKWNTFTSDLSIIKDSFKGAGEEIKSRAEDMKTALGDRVEDIKGLWGDLADKTGEKAENIKNSFGDMKTSIGDKFAEIKTNVGSKMEEVRKNLQDKTQDIKTDWGDKWENVKKKFGDVWADIKKNGGDKLGEIKKNIEDGSGNIKKGWCDTWDAIGNKIGEVWDGIKNTVKDGANGVIGWIEGLINKVIDGINWLTDGMNQALHFEAPDWVRDTFGVDSFGLSLPTINQVSLPRLATGTVVPPNYGEFLAVLGDNKRETEVVSPLSTIRQAVAEAGGNGNIKIDQKIYLDGRQIYKAIIEEGKQAKKRTGRNPFMLGG